MNKQQHGFGTVEIILIVAVVALLGVVGWMAYSRSNQAKQSDSATSESVEDRDGQAEEATPASKQYLEVPEAGIKIPLSTGINDLTYKLQSEGDDGSYIFFSSDQIAEACSAAPIAESGLGSLSAIYEQGDYTDATLLGQVNSRYLYYYPPDYIDYYCEDKGLKQLQEEGMELLQAAIRQAEPLN